MTKTFKQTSKVKRLWRLLPCPATNFSSELAESLQIERVKGVDPYELELGIQHRHQHRQAPVSLAGLA